MGVLDLVRSLVRVAEPSEPSVPRLGSVAQSYVETGEPPDDSWRAHEGPNGELSVVVTVGAGPVEGPSPEDVEAVRTEIRGLGGAVEHAGENGVLLATVSRARLAELAEYDRVRQLEVTRTIEGR